MKNTDSKWFLANPIYQAALGEQFHITSYTQPLSIQRQHFTLASQKRTGFVGI